MQVVITTIFPPTEGARKLAEGLEKAGPEASLWVVGDRKGPESYDLPATRFFSIDEQKGLPFQLARLLPEKSYTRKNLGYLLAMREKPACIVETDDDNIPREDFWETRSSLSNAREVGLQGWYNAYRSFTETRIWPRGLPLEKLQESWQRGDLASEATTPGESLIQQGLADENPDVDAVFRLTADLPISFDPAPPVRLAAGCWCPFNSQNTTFFPQAFPLLYLPSHCTFRMTDIWRSFVAQRCLWSMGSTLLFSKATVFQQRNEHNLLRDFEDEIPGYLLNDRIRELLSQVSLKEGRETAVVCENLRRCYEALVRENIVATGELELVSAWIADISAILA